MDGDIVEVSSQISLVCRISWNNLKNYKSSLVRHVFIFESKGGKRLLGVPTKLDKTVQHLFESSVDPITKAFADKYSNPLPPQLRCSSPNCPSHPKSWSRICMHSVFHDISKYLLDVGALVTCFECFSYVPPLFKCHVAHS